MKLRRAARGIWDLVEQMEESAQKNAYVSLVYFAKDAVMGNPDMLQTGIDA